MVYKIYHLKPFRKLLTSISSCDITGKNYGDQVNLETATANEYPGNKINIY